MWTLITFLLLLVLGVCAYITWNKVQRERYNPYLLKPLMGFYALFGVIFLVSSLYFLTQL